MGLDRQNRDMSYMFTLKNYRGLNEHGIWTYNGPTISPQSRVKQAPRLLQQSSKQQAPLFTKLERAA